MIQTITQILQEAVYRIPALLIAITFHEVAHGWVAYKLGDPTAKNMGRLTLNPIPHIDPIGALMLLIARFGWAKPVPVNPLYFRGDRRRGMVLVSLAGPLANFILAFVISFLIYIVIYLLPVMELSVYVLQFLLILLIYNVYLGIFNLLPVPPLDGSKILANLLHPRHTGFFLQLERYGFLILLLLIFTGALQFLLIPANHMIMFLGRLFNFSWLLLLGGF